MKVALVVMVIAVAGCRSDSELAQEEGGRAESKSGTATDIPIYFFFLDM